MPKLKFGLRFFLFFFFVQPQFAIKSLIRMRDDLTLMCAWHGVMADEERFMRWKISLFQALGSWGRGKTKEEKTRED